MYPNFASRNRIAESKLIVDLPTRDFGRGARYISIILSVCGGESERGRGQAELSPHLMMEEAKLPTDTNIWLR